MLIVSILVNNRCFSMILLRITKRIHTGCVYKRKIYLSKRLNLILTSYFFTSNLGVIDTNFHECLGFDKTSVEYAAIMDQYAKMHPMVSESAKGLCSFFQSFELVCFYFQGRIGATDECVNAIAFLAHENAGFVTGCIFPVDGGLSVKSPRGC